MIYDLLLISDTSIRKYLYVTYRLWLMICCLYFRDGTVFFSTESDQSVPLLWKTLNVESDKIIYAALVLVFVYALIVFEVNIDFPIPLCPKSLIFLFRFQFKHVKQNNFLTACLEKTWIFY